MSRAEINESAPIRVLMVDDEPRILELFSDMLMELGHQVTTTADPEEALRLTARDRFDIVFLDQYLGRIKGIDLMEEMASTVRDIYYVIVTASGSADLAVEAFQRGAADFITKPFFIDDLLRSIAYVNRKRELDLRQKRAMAELELRVRENTDELLQINFSVLTALARAVEKKDLGTYGHSRRVSGYAERIAGRLGLPWQEVSTIGHAALLHDIGKIGISDSILGKPGPLSLEERDTIQRHPENGVEILKPLKHYLPILPAILHHHEHYDGSGYPDGRKGESIPLPARIIAVADTWDAILSDRPYRGRQFRARAVDQLQSEAGKQFDPRIVQAFLELAPGDNRTFCGDVTGDISAAMDEMYNGMDTM